MKLKLNLNRTVLKRVILCASAVLIAYGAVRLVLYGADLIRSRQTVQELKEITEETAATETPAPSATPAVTKPAPAKTATAVPVTATPVPAARAEKLPAVDYPNGYKLVSYIQKLRKKSGYIIGWIKMDRLDEPVALKDNTYFLDHDAMGKRNVNGAVFMDENTRLLTRPYTILLYGHNMKTGAMFGGLKKYEDYSYFLKHRVFRFDTLYEEGQYAAFAVETIHLTPGRNGYISLPDLQSTEKEARRKAIQALARQSMFGPTLDVNEEDQLLLLITCTGDDDERLILAARRLRDGETPERLALYSPASSR